jgi:ferredoxin-NADP reductase
MTRVRVAEIVDETPTIRSFRLVRCDGGPLAPYSAGAHIDVTGPTGTTRQYSLCGPAAETGSYLIAVKREEPSRGGSAALHERVAVGDELTVGEPRSLVGLAPDAARHLLLAAGIGITPLLSMAHQVHAAGGVFRLHYFARSREQAAFVPLLERSGFAERVRFHFGVARAEQAARLDAILIGLDEGTHVYTCGPEGFMQRVAESVPEDRLHIEHFQALEPADEPGAEFELEIDTGEVFTVPAHRSILDVLEENGFAVDTSCREGICGTCVLPVLDGEPDHRDNCLTKKEKAAGDQIAVCVSRARGPRLVVEL